MASKQVNDGACDRPGRFFAGTWPTRITGEGAPLTCGRRSQGTGLLPVGGIYTGIGWSPDDRRWYYIDSLYLRVDLFDYGAQQVAIGKPPHVRHHRLRAR